jgi:tetratricopeptide (TPR) repeat protein
LVRCALILGLLASAWLCQDLGAVPFWLDSGELAAAGGELGIMHPPGAPGLALIFHLATVLPIATLAWRIAWANAILASLALACLVVLLQRRGARWWWSSALVFYALAGLTFARQARVVEIYAYGCALLMGWLVCVDPLRRQSPQYDVLGGLIAGLGALGFADLRLMFLPVLPLWLFHLHRCNRLALLRAVVGLSLATIIGLSLALISARAPFSDWGQPDNLQRLWDHVQATSIREAYADKMGWPAAGEILHNAQRFLSRLAGDLGSTGLALALVALLASWIYGPNRRAIALVAWIVACELGYSVLLNPMGEVDRQCGIPLYLVVALILGATPLLFAIRRPASVQAMMAASLVLLAVTLWPVQNADRPALRSWFPSYWFKHATSPLPVGALVLTQSDDFAAQAIASRVFEGWRPDLVILPAQHLYRRTPQAAARDPRLKLAWDLAHHGQNESERVARLVEKWPGAVALEQGGSGLFAGLKLPSAGWEPPLAIARWSSTPSQQKWLLWGLRWAEHDEDKLRLTRAWLAYVRERAMRGSRTELLAVEAEISLLLRDVTPFHVGAMNSLAAVWDRLGYTDKALALSEAVLEIDPRSSAARSNWARIHMRQKGEFSQAIDVLETGLRYQHNDAILLRELVRLCQPVASANDQRCQRWRATQHKAADEP